MGATPMFCKFLYRLVKLGSHIILALKVPITTVADDQFCDIFLHLTKKKYDTSWELSASMKYHALFVSSKTYNCRLLQIIGGALNYNE